jgi:CubicO group peptidase (beta-lactamase class C family)
MPEPGDSLDEAAGIIRAAVRAGHVPGAVAATGKGPTVLATWAVGQADTTAGSARPMRAQTRFDLASLTKVVGTATAVLTLAARGDVGLDAPAGRYLPSFDALRAVTVRQLLSHASGLPGSRKFYRWCAARDELLRDLAATPLEAAAPGTRVTYSDPGYMALGQLVSAVTGEPLDAAVGHLVTGPLGMTMTGYNPAVQYHDFAATEPRPDGTAPAGVVHDENARLMGGAAGHAGLFAPVADLATFAVWWVSQDDSVVPAALRREAERCQTAGLGGRRGLGWACTGDSFDILHGTWPPGSVSHTGFTGTSLALDSASGAWLVLLTNSVHFGRAPDHIKALRRDLHAALAPRAARM